MSTISTPTLRLISNDDYEPASQDGRIIQQIWDRERNYLSNSAADWAPTLSASLRAVREISGCPNWDGEGATPIADLTLRLTEIVVAALFRLLPKGTPSPDLIPEPDGEICVSWPVDSTHIFSLSIGAQGKINFAGQFGNKGSVHGWQPIDAKNSLTIEASLADVVRYISRLHAINSIRTAA